MITTAALLQVYMSAFDRKIDPAESVLSEKRRRTLILLDIRVKAALWSPLREESEPAEVLRFWLDKQDSRDEREILNEPSKPGVGNERDSWGVGEGERNVRNVRSKANVREDERGKRNERDSWGNWNKQSKWSTAGVQNDEEGKWSKANMPQGVKGRSS
ncbi:MAG: hypothetical protein WAP53_03835 [Dysgonamonadaceae bacterium]